MRLKLGRALACAILPAALAAAIWLPPATADEPAGTPREFVSDTFGGATRTAVTGECVRIGFPEAGSSVAECVGGPVETAKTASPPAPRPPTPVTPVAAPAVAAPAVAPVPAPKPAAAPVPEVAAVPEPVEVAPEPIEMAPVTPAPEESPASEPPALEDQEVAAAVADEQAAAEPEYAEEIADTEEAIAEEQQAEVEAPPEPEIVETPPPPPTEASPAPAPVAPAQPEMRKLRLMADVHFQFDRAQLTPAGMSALDQLVGGLDAAHIGAVTIVGYTDRIGPQAYNQKLSERRADSVKQYLSGRNLEADRIEALGRGMNDPVTGPDACKGLRGKRLIKCLAPDRRVEIEVVGLAPAR